MHQGGKMLNNLQRVVRKGTFTPDPPATRLPVVPSAGRGSEHSGTRIILTDKIQIPLSG